MDERGIGLEKLKEERILKGGEFFLADFLQRILGFGEEEDDDLSPFFFSGG